MCKCQISASLSVRLLLLSNKIVFFFRVCGHDDWEPVQNELKTENRNKSISLYLTSVILLFLNQTFHSKNTLFKPLLSDCVIAV